MPMINWFTFLCLRLFFCHRLNCAFMVANSSWALLSSTLIKANKQPNSWRYKSSDKLGSFFPPNHFSAFDVRRSWNIFRRPSFYLACLTIYCCLVFEKISSIRSNNISVVSVERDKKLLNLFGVFLFGVKILIERENGKRFRAPTLCGFFFGSDKRFFLSKNKFIWAEQTSPEPTLNLTSFYFGVEMCNSSRVLSLRVSRVCVWFYIVGWVVWCNTKALDWDDDPLERYYRFAPICECWQSNKVLLFARTIQGELEKAWRAILEKHPKQTLQSFPNICFPAFSFTQNP